MTVTVLYKLKKQLFNCTNLITFPNKVDIVMKQKIILMKAKKNYLVRRNKKKHRNP